MCTSRLLRGCLALIVIVPALGRCATAADTPTPVLTDAARAVGRSAGFLSTYATEHFQMVYTTNPAWARQTGRLLEQSHDQFYRSFTELGFTLRPTREKLGWICFTSREDFDRYTQEADKMDMSWLDEYYSARTNRVALVCRPAANPPREAAQVASVTVSANISALQPATSASDASWSAEATRASHEAAHQLAFNSGMMKRGVTYPLWAAEGLATNFETDAQGNFGIGHDNPARLRELVKSWSAGTLMPLTEFAAFTRVPVADHEAANAAYAQSWGFFRFLMEHHRAALRRYLDDLAQLDPGRRPTELMRMEFIAAFGPIEKLEPEWHAYVEARAAASAPQTAQKGTSKP